ncbi:uncharacterized protein LOC110446471 isoform X1 [Mizuhopecten yessoensis]|uniref:Low-density lipoprotein receptor-related protein 12 n=1 Tax=Mizuhopecten yessoensis TaxID=6573 RepID=A0A210R7E1_MIZYE|nr:uncharacterized protein LOC110446471 isoform X1 [Mizuhopecten yessoensis]OWF56878.1 Low-density lipoprotein receptor-related protein 12 [Mizuhopecten yessoensis]
MAHGPDWVSQSWCFLWIFTLLLSESQTKKTQTFYMDGVECDDTKHIGGATVYSHNVEKAMYYGEDLSCSITFRPENSGWKLMLRIIELDIPDRLPSGVCNDALYIYDTDSIYAAAMEEAGGNMGLCGNVIPPTLYSSGSVMTVHFRSDVDSHKIVKGRGFKFIITAYSDDFKEHATCGSRFKCTNEWCVDEDLTCDSVDHCGDYSDESTEGTLKCGVKDESFINQFMALGVTASVTITVGSLLVVIVCIVSIVCCCRRILCKPAQDTSSTPSAVTTTPTSVVTNGAPPALHYNNLNNLQGKINNGRQVPFSGHMHQGYYPMQPVFQSPNHSAIYSAYREGFTNSANSAYSSHSQSQPPSYHRSCTPTSSRSGKSNRSNNSTSVTYSQGTDKVSLPVNL